MQSAVPCIPFTLHSNPGAARLTSFGRTASLCSDLLYDIPEGTVVLFVLKQYTNIAGERSTQLYEYHDYNIMQCISAGSFIEHLINQKLVCFFGK